nr:GHKL domain-containing protein [Olsenella profusa]
MRSYHVYSLFGNALDNAVECLSQVEDRSRRVVWLNVEPVGEMVVVRVENYTPSEPVVRGGSLVTTKEDAASHGYGMKSIRNVAEIYGGTAEFFVEDHLFRLVVTMPLAELRVHEQREDAA